MQVRAVDPVTGALSWNASVASFSVQAPPAGQCADTQQRPRRAGGRLVTTAGGAVHAVDTATGERLWTAHLAAPAIAAFGVALGPGPGGPGAAGKAVCEVWETEVRRAGRRAKGSGRARRRQA